MLKTIYTFAVIVLLSVSAVFAQTESDTIQSMLEERDQEIKELLGPKGTDYTQEQRDQLKDIINDVINYQAMAQHLSLIHI